MWIKYIYIESIQITSSSETYQTNIYHNDCYLQLSVFKFRMNNSSFLKQAPPLLSASLEINEALGGMGMGVGCLSEEVQ